MLNEMTEDFKAEVKEKKAMKLHGFYVFTQKKGIIPLDVFKVPAIERNEDEFDVGVADENVAGTGAENHLFMTGAFNSRTVSKDTIVPAVS